MIFYQLPGLKHEFLVKNKGVFKYREQYKIIEKVIKIFKKALTKKNWQDTPLGGRIWPLVHKKYHIFLHLNHGI